MYAILSIIKFSSQLIKMIYHMVFYFSKAFDTLCIGAILFRFFAIYEGKPVGPQFRQIVHKIQD